MSTPIEDYALIGDCRSAALVSRAGSIDWLCWPRFDSPPLFASLIAGAGGGTWEISPLARADLQRRYLPSTNVLETRFVTDGGVAVLTDCFAVASEADKRRRLMADDELLRRVECVSGEVELRMRYRPRGDFGRRPLPVEKLGALGFRARIDGGLVTLRAEVPASIAEDGGVEARFRLRAGEVVRFSLSLALD